MNLIKNLLIYSITLIFVSIQFVSSLPVETPQCMDINNPLKANEGRIVPCPYVHEKPKS
uniref:Uncharacterized protein n=1 Tax=Rhizophagus clarus TaxID=94130 RepID=A0A140D0C3_9GLOM|nr:hypothetical protein [Rhizophagus clarus]